MADELRMALAEVLRTLQVALDRGRADADALTNLPITEPCALNRRTSPIWRVDNLLRGT